MRWHRAGLLRAIHVCKKSVCKIVDGHYGAWGSRREFNALSGSAASFVVETAGGWIGTGGKKARFLPESPAGMALWGGES